MKAFRVCMHGLISMPRSLKRMTIFLVDVVLCCFVTWVAFCLRYDDIVPITNPVIVAATSSVVLLMPILIVAGLHKAIFRYTNWFATILLIKVVLIYTVLYVIIFVIVGVKDVPRSVGLIQPILLFVGIGISRITIKILLDRLARSTDVSKNVPVVLIYGAGSAGRQIASGLRQGGEIRLVGFVDDDQRLWKATIDGFPVYSPADIPRLLNSKLAITDVLLVVPSVSKSQQRRILLELSNFPVHVRLLPGLTDLANGIVKLEDIRDIQIEDLLDREPVAPIEEILHQHIAGEVILVTGAGGSIGSELCRQILMHKPAKLILLEVSEFSLYTIERELTRQLTDVEVVPILGTVLDKDKMMLIIRQFNVRIVYHAAAYKHVPMIEMNPAAGVWNNVFGTLHTLEAACQCNVQSFVLVSTDKAVRPTNVMGCSKRMAELVLQAKSLQRERLGIHSTKLTMVRFGNVLGSSGSVVPLFREQIKQGGPVTVTHPEITRYFMTIREAAQLIIQAGAMGEGGDVMVLDMGEPVKIADLAKRMIHLSGFSNKDEGPNGNLAGDIKIEFSGLRPGEKLYEELLIGDGILPTLHPRIVRAVEYGLSWEELEQILFELEAAVKVGDGKAIRAVLKKAVPEFDEWTIPAIKDTSAENAATP